LAFLISRRITVERELEGAFRSPRKPGKPVRPRAYARITWPATIDVQPALSSSVCSFYKPLYVPSHSLEGERERERERIEKDRNIIAIGFHPGVALTPE